jgi:hypothetical protein
MPVVTKPGPELIGPALVSHLPVTDPADPGNDRPAHRHQPVDPGRVTYHQVVGIAPRQRFPGTPVALTVTSRLPDWMVNVNPKLFPAAVPPPPRGTTAPP